MSRTVVIGLGNPLMGDDGLGLAALARLRQTWDVSGDVDLVEGVTWGLNLLPAIESAQRLLLIDAIEIAAPPGTEVVLEGTDLPRRLVTKISPHQVDVLDVLALAELRGTLPAQTIALGLQPAMVALSNGLSEPLRGRLDDLVHSVVRRLDQWGHRCTHKGDVHHARQLSVAPDTCRVGRELRDAG
jgi:hydrogenase maturation protease